MKNNIVTVDVIRETLKETLNSFVVQPNTPALEHAVRYHLEQALQKYAIENYQSYSALDDYFYIFNNGYDIIINIRETAPEWVAQFANDIL